MISLNQFLITILILSILVISQYSASGINELSAGLCINGNNQTNNQIQDRFQDNLQSLFQQFRLEAASRRSYYHFNATGKSPDRAYGHYLCRGDTNSDLCSRCVNNLIIVTNAICREGVTSTDTCMVYYANYSFQGKSTNNTVPGTMFGLGETTAEFNRTVVGVVEGLITDVASISTEIMRRYATREARVGGSREKVYGLAQCTPYISKGDCSECLKAAFLHMKESGGDSLATYVMLPSCQLRYKKTRFYYRASTAATANLPGVAVNFLLVTGWGLLLISWLIYY